MNEVIALSRRRALYFHNPVTREKMKQVSAECVMSAFDEVRNRKDRIFLPPVFFFAKRSGMR